LAAEKFEELKQNVWKEDSLTIPKIQSIEELELPGTCVDPILVKQFIQNNFQKIPSRDKEIAWWLRRRLKLKKNTHPIEFDLDDVLDKFIIYFGETILPENKIPLSDVQLYKILYIQILFKDFRSNPILDSIIHRTSEASGSKSLTNSSVEDVSESNNHFNEELLKGLPRESTKSEKINAREKLFEAPLQKSERAFSGTDYRSKPSYKTENRDEYDYYQSARATSSQENLVHCNRNKYHDEEAASSSNRRHNVNSDRSQNKDSDVSGDGRHSINCDGSKNKDSDVSSHSRQHAKNDMYQFTDLQEHQKEKTSSRSRKDDDELLDRTRRWIKCSGRRLDGDKMPQMSASNCNICGSN